MEDGKWRIVDVSVNCKHRCPSSVSSGWWHCFHHDNTESRCKYDLCPLKFNDQVKGEIKRWKERKSP